MDNHIQVLLCSGPLVLICLGVSRLFLQPASKPFDGRKIKFHCNNTSETVISYVQQTTTIRHILGAEID